jgi:hypothetical protein
MTLATLSYTLATLIKGNWTHGPIAYPNRQFSPPKNATWLRYSTTFGNTYEAEKGDDGLGMRIGTLHLQLFTSINTGNRVGLGYSDELEGIFRRYSIDGLWFGEPTTYEIGNEPGGYYQININVPFTVWVGES